MLRMSMLSIIFPFFISLFLFSSNAVGSENKIVSIKFLNGKENFLESDKSCVVKNKKIDDVVINNNISIKEIEQCIAECSYLIGIPGDYGSSRFHACVTQCKGMIPMCTF
ncbi:hypothetical protein PEC301653_37600 [Pectobacterium carotovorum subsp. carotovorum]|nr:hypothetical protein PCC21_038480 [Pectobacterium carotovorum subsp. carotovorum PCC21]GKW00715.1 hypothetical protein PEC301653_37600 [Pectobacterium carotovorum subsp. carotovorum]